MSTICCLQDINLIQNDWQGKIKNTRLGKRSGRHIQNVRMAILATELEAQWELCNIDGT